MSASLRPMGLGEILDRTIQIYRSRFLVFVGIALAAPIARVAVILLDLLFDEVLGQTTLSSSVKHSLQEVDVTGFASLVTAFVGAAAVSPLTYAASLEFLGERSTIRGSIARCVIRWRSWLLYSAIVCAVVYVAPLAILNPSILLRSLGWPAAGNIGTVNLGLMVSLGRWLMEFLLGAVVLLGAPVWILEGRSSWAAIRRGVALATRDSVMAMFVAWILESIVLWIVAIATTSVPVFLLRIISTDVFRGNFVLYRVVFLTGASISEALAGPLYLIAITLIYYDQRIRKEGYDIEHLMDAAGMSVPATPTVVAGESAEAEVQPG